MLLSQMHEPSPNGAPSVTIQALLIFDKLLYLIFVTQIHCFDPKPLVMRNLILLCIVVGEYFVLHKRKWNTWLINRMRARVGEYFARHSSVSRPRGSWMRAHGGEYCARQ
jgi:hypothetical protein